MEILSWNIQAGLGCDGKLDLARIAGDIKAFGDPDVICLQEVARHCEELDGTSSADQAVTLAMLFPDHEPVYGAGFDQVGRAPDRRRQFGNLLLSRLPLLQVFHHILPNPTDPGVARMSRVAVEVVVEGDVGPLRLITTHLAYHSTLQRLAQVRRLRALTAEVAGALREPSLDRPGTPFAQASHPASSVFCGDFNLVPGSPEYDEMLAPFDDGTPAILDAWSVIHGEKPHDPTCGIFDREHWTEGPHCRDFFFITEDLALRAKALEVNLTSAASDHQPLRLVLAP
ncbi:MAG: endonuclease/exonuclease/phosphatase family protein [Pseudomonadota bacterium]